MIRTGNRSENPDRYTTRLAVFRNEQTADKAQALAGERTAAVRDAFVAGDDVPSVAADRVILAAWTPDKGAAATGRAGVYVELQDGD